MDRTETDYWEQQVAEALEKDAWRVIPLAHLPAENGRGPHVHGGGDITLPDLQATKHGKSIAVEVKYKTKSIGGRLSGKPEHGIDQPKYDAYLEYDRTMMPTYLVIVEGTPAVVALGARITTLTVRCSHINDREPMAYFTRDQLVEGWPKVLKMLNQHVYQSGWKQARALRQEEGLF